jgi:anti-sigma factor RsiW
MSTPKEPTDAPILARDAIYHRAPDALRERVLRSLAAEAAGTDAPRKESPHWLSGGIAAILRPFAGWRVASAGIAFAAVALMSWNAALLYSRPSGDDLLVRDVLNAHVRSLIAENHLNDVISTDQHTVKPWFTGKLDFAPPVQDYASSGFELAGGRLDYVNGRPVAALVYRHRLHTVNVFIWPAAEAGNAAARVQSINGYALAQWRAGGMQYWAASDVAPADLVALGQVVEASVGAPASR